MKKNMKYMGWFQNPVGVDRRADESGLGKRGLNSKSLFQTPAGFEEARGEVCPRLPMKSSASFSKFIRFKQVLGLGLLIMALPACTTPPATEKAPAETAVPAPAEQAPAPESGPPEIPEYAEPRPRPAIRDELMVALSKGDGVELDFRKSYLASEAQLFTALYEGLFSYHPFTMEPVPALAARWVVSEDKKQWTFTIRENARYWNGDPVQAEDFRKAWISLLEPAKESPYSSLFDIIEGARDFRTGVLKDPAQVG
ncbi:MAG: ABC transporter substrate-binding protein, partial [Treponema sp.]|nr:ABC transporter substrate-binding protein [Treponema sp.]